MEYADIDQVSAADGLRLVLVRGFPSPWGQAAKAMMEFKGLEFMAGAQQAGGKNPELVAWAGTNSGPVVAWNDEAPLNRWDDILMLLERLAPDKPLIPEDPAARAESLGLAQLICGQLGFGWNIRLVGTHDAVQAGKPVGYLGEKYGYNETDGPLALERVLRLMNHLASLLDGQTSRGSAYLLGDSVTAPDFYWAAFSNLVQIQSAEECPLDAQIRTRFERQPPVLAEALPPSLIEHRDHIMRNFFKIPMEL